MLSDNPILPILLAKDLEESKRFYAEGLGLPIVEENEKQVTFALSGDSRLRLSASKKGTKDSQTQATWIVADLRAEIEQLRARGVTIEEYDTKDVQTVDGIADQGEAWVSYITDPGGNVLGIEQPK